MQRRGHILDLLWNRADRTYWWLRCQGPGRDKGSISVFLPECLVEMTLCIGMGRTGQSHGIVLNLTCLWVS